MRTVQGNKKGRGAREGREGKKGKGGREEGRERDESGHYLCSLAASA